jgi:hypothetical protein
MTTQQQRVVLGRQNNEAHPREAAFGSRYSVIKDLLNRRSAGNRGGVSISPVPASSANISLRQHELAVGIRPPASYVTQAPPTIFTSFAGYVPKGTAASKYSIRKGLFLAGRMDDGIDYEGMAPVQDYVSVQKGGVTSFRYYNFDDKPVSHGDYLIWDVIDPDVSKNGAQLSKIKSYTNQHLPAGTIPIEAKPLSQIELREFPIHAYKIYLSNPSAFIDFNNKSTFVKAAKFNGDADAVDRYIVHGIIMPVVRAANVLGIQFNDEAALKKAIADYNVGLTPGASKDSSNQAMLALGAQYDAWIDVWSRCFGMALAVGHSRDLVKVILRP